MRIKDLSCVGIKLHCYSLRVDHCKNDCSGAHPFFKPFFNWLNNKFDYVLVGDEIAETPPYQPHWQCIAFRKERYGEKDIRQLRYEIKKADWLDKTRHKAFSLKNSTSPLGLFKYCQKGGVITTNLPEKLYREIAYLAEKYYKKPLEDTLRECAQTVTPGAYADCTGTYAAFRSFYDNVYQAFIEERILTMPRKLKMWNIALKYNLIPPNVYFIEFYSPF